MMKYFKVKIIKHTQLLFGNKKEDMFHKDMIGQTISVRNSTDPNSTYYECETGESILKSDVLSLEPPYDYNTDNTSRYNPNFGDHRECQCGHSYYRHFDSYENMEAIGCKYCGCKEFKLSRQDKIALVI